MSQYCYHCTHATTWIPSTDSTPVQLHTEDFPLLYVAESLESCSVSPAPRPEPPTFTEYLRSASTDDYNLLEIISWDKPPSEVLSIILHLPDSDRLLIVSDGSSRELRTMSYGAVIGTQSGTILASVCGPAYGMPSSNRAEGTGTYAAALLLRHLFRYCHCNVRFFGTAVTVSDNRQVLNWLVARRGFDTVYANDTLKTDYDLLEATHQIYSELEWPQHKYLWVKGHQDRDKDFSRLPRLAQYNCLADELADLYVKTVDSSFRPVTPLLPGTKCVLNIRGSSVTSHYLANIRRAASMKDYRLHLKRNQAWESDVFDSVDWSSFQRAARNYSSSDVHLLKLVYQQLPTKAHLHRQRPHLQKCSHCEQPETLEHLITIPCNPITKAFQRALISRTTTYLLKVSAPEVFQALVLSALRRGIGQPNDDVIDDDLWEPFDDLFQSQSKIGWYHFVRGFWSAQWHTVYATMRPGSNATSSNGSDSSDGFSTHAHSCSSDQFLPSIHDWELDIEVAFVENTYEKKPLDEYTVIAGTIRTIWTELSALWLHQCDSEHGTSGDSPLHLAHLRDQIRTLHSFYDQVHPADREALFRPDLEDFLSSATAFQLRNHIATIKPMILRSKRRYTRQILFSGKVAIS